MGVHFEPGGHRDRERQLRGGDHEGAAHVQRNALRCSALFNVKVHPTHALKPVRKHQVRRAMPDLHARGVWASGKNNYFGQLAMFAHGVWNTAFSGWDSGAARIIKSARLNPHA